jgi:hypothetical protein
MNKFVRNNQKKILGVFGAALMVVFIIQLAPNGRGQNGNLPTDVTAGTIAGDKITVREVSLGKDEWQQLKTIGTVHQNPADPQGPGLPMPYWLLPYDFPASRAAADAINANPVTFFLLAREAKREGISVNPEEVQSLINSDIALNPSQMPTTDDEKTRLENTISDFLAVRMLLQQVTNMVKITTPLRQWDIARDGQELTLNFVQFSADQFLSAVPEPDQAAIQKQYDKFAGKLPNVYGSPDDPLGFGYQYPNRIALQFIGFRESDLKDAARNSKSLQDWYNAAFKEFKANRADYDERPVPLGPATQPATQPGLLSAANNLLNAATQPTDASLTSATTQLAGAATQLASSATQSTTIPVALTGVRKVDDIADDFAIHADLVLDDLYNQEARKTAKAITKQIQDAMNKGYSEWRDAQSKKAAASTQPVQTAYSGMDFIDNLATSIRAQYGINVIKGNVDRFMTFDDLKTLPDIGKTYVESSYSSMGFIPFANYATALLAPIMPEEVKTSPLAAQAISPMQPSQPVSDFSGNDFVFRVTKIDLSHPAPLDEVKDQVTADAKRAAAYDLAVAAANKTMAAALTSTLNAAAATAPGHPTPVETSPFNPLQIASADQQSIEPLKLKPDSVKALAKAAQDLVSTASNHGKHPMLVAQLYPDAMAAVIELNLALPMTQYANLLIERDRSITSAELLQKFCSYDATIQRINFVPAENVKLNQ